MYIVGVGKENINSETTLSNKTESAEGSTQAVYVVVLLFAKYM